MKLNYAYAVVSFCPDLTNPTARSVPIAGVLLGETVEEAVASIAWFRVHDESFKNDPLSAAVMRDLPKLLQDHIDEAWDGMRAGRARPEDLLRSLQHSLRNSLHIAQVFTSIHQDLADGPSAVTNFICNEATRRLDEAVKEAGMQALLRPTSPSSKSRIASAPPVAPVAKRSPGVTAWGLEPRRTEDAHP